MVLVQSSQVTYSGGGWYGDWYEHYERALVFGGFKGLSHRFSGEYHLTARPPLFNVLAYYYMTFIGFEFSDYQIVASFVGCTVLLPGALLLARFFAPRMDNRSEGAARVYLFVALLLLLHPMTATNLIYPWTRMLTNAFVLTGCYFYLRAMFEPRYRLLPRGFSDSERGAPHSLLGGRRHLPCRSARCLHYHPSLFCNLEVRFDGDCHLSRFQYLLVRLVHRQVRIVYKRLLQRHLGIHPGRAHRAFSGSSGFLVGE